MDCYARYVSVPGVVVANSMLGIELPAARDLSGIHLQIDALHHTRMHWF